MPLSAARIKSVIWENGDSIAGLARQWGYHREDLSRVIHRTPGYAYPDLRQLLADYLGRSEAAVFGSLYKVRQKTQRRAA
jgi:lambda repressor-like predicted transcriptional regulator